METSIEYSVLAVITLWYLHRLVDSHRVLCSVQNEISQASGPGQRQSNCLLYPRSMVDLNDFQNL